MNKKGWNLESGEYKKKVLADDEIWTLFNEFCSNKSVKNTAYKFIFIR